MKILAIRGCNLASLAGEFEIDLARGPLGTAGVFAIVGPTGAGKSTLLDAMCVALFDRTPRLANRSTVVVGRGEDDPTALGAQDVRSLLRRGASQGWAEVDFESGDSRRYRARWSVRRARNATDGRFQSQQVTLTAIDGGEQLGGTKTETLEAIHQRLGLSFDQFRRSALLAQGDFAAFLRADGKDRSELLERMTGTEIYSRLSVAAHVRATLAVQRLREQQGAALAIPVLADDERARTEQELELAKEAQVAARSRLVAAEAAARWLDEATRRQQALADAETGRRSAERAIEAAAAQRAELALRRRAEALRAPWEEAVRLDRQLALARADATAQTDAAARAEASQRELAKRRARIAALHQPIREARIAAGLVERPGGAAAPAPRGRRATTEPPAARTRGAPASDARPLELRADAAASDAAWLLVRSELGALVATWLDLDARFAQRLVLAAEIASADQLLADRARVRDELGRQRSIATGEHQSALARLAEAQAEAAGFQQRRGLSLDAARRAEDDARRRCSDFEQLVTIASEARAAAAARASLEAQVAELVERAARDAERRHIAESERDRAILLRDERARMVEELRKAAGYEHARTELVEGDPCPLCGATEHPWRDRGSLDVLIVDAQGRLAEATQQAEAALATLVMLDARQAQRVTEEARLAAQRATLVSSVEHAGARWRATLAALGELPLVSEPATDAAAQLAIERVEDARGKLEAARAARSQAEAVAKAAAEAQGTVQARHTELEHHALAVRALDGELATLDAAIERVRGERTGKLERLHVLLAELDGALAQWHDALEPTDASTTDSLQTLLELARGELARLHTSAGTSAPALSIERCRHALSELAIAWADRAERIASLDAELGAALATAETAARDADRVLVEQLARRDAAIARHDAARRELQEAAERLDSARIAAGFDAEELRRLLSESATRAEELAAQLDALDRAADRAHTLVVERRRTLDDHDAASPFVATEASAGPDAARDLRRDAAQLDELAAQVTAADHHAAALAAALVADGDARARRAEALARFAAAEQHAEVDRVLGEVIGSHDGKLFRSFAQSLTLDGLLAVANSHLEELAPRYQLERVPRHDLELQVIDRDLGNEIRSVQSLSGGESFLVSLALALGLSSMSAHDVRVRTLLIDEGFGTLDPATLDSALAVLDALQATGRQVGVISHVPALVERVGAHVRVFPRGGGKSEVVVAEA